jgi:hypothetical protein
MPLFTEPAATHSPLPSSGLRIDCTNDGSDSHSGQSGGPCEGGEHVDALWSRLSQRYSAVASGTALGFISHGRPDSILSAVEYPALLANPKITSVLTGGK